MPPCAEIDLLPGFVCFFVGLLYELEMGIFTGVSTSLCIYISTCIAIHIYISTYMYLQDNISKYIYRWAPTS